MKMPDGYINILHPDGKGTEVRVEQKELVMCKHCKHLDSTGMLWHCTFGLPHPDGFCSYGERKDGENHD